MAQDTEPTGQARTERRHSRWMIALLVVSLLWLLSALTPSPFVIERPGPVINALGDTYTPDSKVPVIEISGTEWFETSGELNVLSVSIHGTPDSPMSWFEVGLALFDPSGRIAPVGEVFPEGQSAEDRARVSEAMMTGSQQLAVAAALRELSEPVEQQLSIAEVTPGGASAGKLESGDVLRSVDGAPVATVEQLSDALSALDGSTEITIGIERDGEPRQVRVTPMSSEPGARPLLGVQIATQFEFPFEVEINIGDIGGPSAGLIFALSIYDRLTPGALVGDLDVSGTGTIVEDGTVGAIGGLEQKMWGASRDGTDLFLMPVENCADLPERIPGDMRVAPVASLEEAIDAIESAVRGEDPPGLERCETAGEFVSGDR